MKWLSNMLCNAPCAVRGYAKQIQSQTHPLSTEGLAESLSAKATYGFVLGPNVAIEHSVVDRFLDVVRLDGFAFLQVCDGARHA